VLKKLSVLIGVALVLVLLDQWAKYEIASHLTYRFEGKDTWGARMAALYSGKDAQSGLEGYHFRPKRSITIADGYLRLRYAENPGAAWGLFRNFDERIRGPLFHLVSLGAVVLITFYFLRLTGDRRERWAYLGLPLVLGGALGNYVDRLARGFVIDFIEAHWHDTWYFPSFNVADSCITVGVAMLVLDAIFRREGQRSTARSTSPRA
jgi:signal peptidase II